MPNDVFRFALELFRENGQSLGQTPVEVDWDPVREFTRFAELRRTGRPSGTDPGAGPVLPVWHDTMGPPYAAGFRIACPSASADAPPCEVPLTYLSDQARSLATGLVTAGQLAKGETFFYRALAFPEPGAEASRSPFTVETVPTTPTLVDGDLSALKAAATMQGDQAAGNLPVYLAQRVLDEAVQLSAAGGGNETGGILIGNLKRDTGGQGLYLEVGAQIPARHTVADETSLAFTPETWTQVQAALDLRNRDEIMAGWWHLHPIKKWCHKCPPVKRKQCPLLVDYFSREDKLLHRTVFPAAYSVALVVNELADDAQTLSMFGWRDGQIVQRGFQIPDAPGTPDSRTREQDPEASTSREPVSKEDAR